MTTEIITFGCRLNAYESEIMAGLAKDARLDDTVIVNTCAVTAEAERQARQAIRRARRARPGAHIIVTGCAAQIAPERYAAMPEVDRVIGNREKLEAQSFGVAQAARVAVNDIMEVRETAQHLVGGFDGRARAFVQVQQGCDHRCTFCIIPYGRGPSQSVALGPIVEQVRLLVENGYREIVLTGVDITSWGADLPARPTLGQLVRRLLAAVPELPRLRLTSLDPAEIDDALWQAFAEEPRLMPHLHLSLQAGDDMILKRMKRRHSRADAIAFCARARRLRPDVAFGADIIAGFPTETEAMFQNTLDLVAACDLTFLHVFPYSERPGTPAARMPALPVAERKARAARLRAAGEAALARFLDGRVGHAIEVLVEKDGFGRSEHFAPVVFDGTASAGTVMPMRARASTGAAFVGEPAS
ncbi:MAG: tRNA (N(6)-L-threonylcarbamoyladenosine(37)-C(2))-methylthiotransferase MtaB [Candidatus Eiseniibacteriota bacterium]